MVQHVKLVKWLVRGETPRSAGIESGKNLKNFKKIEKFIFSLQLATAPIYTQTRRNHITTEHKRLVVKVLSTLLCLPGSKPRHRTTKDR